MTYNWNKVYIGYRDGASFGGTMGTTMGTTMGILPSRDVDVHERAACDRRCRGRNRRNSP